MIKRANIKMIKEYERTKEKEYRYKMDKGKYDRW
jgi:hypothetical protein